MEDNEILELEQQTDSLINKYQELRRKNADLVKNQSALLEERAQLKQRNQQAADKIKSMISRLKTIEAATHE